MRSIRMFLVLTLLCGVWILHGKTEALPPRLEIVSAIYGKGPEAVDLTDKVRKEIKAGSYLEFRNNPRFTGKNFRDRKADKNIRIAPTFPPNEELEVAMDVFCICTKLAACEKLLEA